MPGVGLWPRGTELVIAGLEGGRRRLLMLEGSRRVCWGWRGSAWRARSTKTGRSRLGGRCCAGLV